MRFIFIREIFEALEMSSANIDDDSLQIAKNKLLDLADTQIAGSIQVGGQELSQTDIRHLAHEMSNSKYLIFQDWINSNKQLRYLLTNNDAKESYSGDNRFAEHFLLGEFKTYLSQYLHPLLKKKCETAFYANNFNDSFVYASYFQLLNTDSERDAQYTLNNCIRAKCEDAKAKTAAAKSVDEFNKELFFLTKRPIIELTNILNKEFYNTRLEVVNLAVISFRNRHFTQGFAKKVFTAVKNVKLNPEHQEQITKLSTYLNTNKVKTVNQGYSVSKSGKFNTKSILPFLGITAIVTTIVLLIVFLGGSKPVDIIHDPLVTGFDSLDINQVRNIDSTLGHQEQGDSAMIERVQSNIPTLSIPVALSFVEAEIKNEKVKVLFKSFITDYDLQEKLGLYQECNDSNKVDFKNANYDNLSSIENNTGFEHVLTNKSYLDAFVLVYDDKSSGAAYGFMIPKNGKARIKLQNGQKMMFYCGLDMTTFNPAKAANKGYNSIVDANKVDDNFDKHFCFMDAAAFAFMNKVYETKDLSNSLEESVLKTAPNGEMYMDSYYIYY